MHDKCTNYGRIMWHYAWFMCKLWVKCHIISIFRSKWIWNHYSGWNTYSMSKVRKNVPCWLLDKHSHTHLLLGGVTLSIFSKVMVRLTWKFFGEDFYEFSSQKNFLGSIRTFYGRRIFYEYRTFCKISYFRYFEAIFTKIEWFLGQ